MNERLSDPCPGVRSALNVNDQNEEASGGPACLPRQRTTAGATSRQESQPDRRTTTDVIAVTGRDNQMILHQRTWYKDHDNRTILRPAIKGPGAWSSRSRAGRHLRGDRGTETDRTKEAAETKVPDGAKDRRIRHGGRNGTKEDGGADPAGIPPGGEAQQRPPHGGQAQTEPL